MDAFPPHLAVYSEAHDRISAPAQDLDIRHVSRTGTNTEASQKNRDLEKETGHGNKAGGPAMSKPEQRLSPESWPEGI